MNLLLKLTDVTARYPGQASPVFQGLNFELGKGEHIAIRGANGTGKSTLLRLMAGLLWTVQGEVAWAGAAGTETSRIYGQQICRLVSPAAQEQIQRQNWNKNGLEFLASASANTNFIITTEDNKKAARDFLLNTNTAYLGELPLAYMSQGQLRLLLFYRAVLAKPKLLLLDELMDGLDSKARQTVLEQLDSLKKGTTMVFATHRPEMLPDWIASNYHLDNGVVTKSAWSSPAPENITHLKTAPGMDTARPLCVIENASVFIERQKVLHNINWTINEGEHWRLTGPNGAGKSTLMRLIAGDETAAAGGDVSIFKNSCEKIATLPEKRKNAVLFSQLGQVRYDYDLEAWELLCTGLDGSIGKYRDYNPEEADPILHFLFASQTDKIKRQSIRVLSTGPLTKLFLGRTMMAKPPLLLLDEPFNGLDEPSRQYFTSFFTRLACGEIPGWRPTIIFTSHYQEDLPAWLFKNTAAISKGHLRVL